MDNFQGHKSGRRESQTMVRRDAMNIEAAFAAWMFIAVRYELLRMTGSGKSIGLDSRPPPTIG
jgi:hypothetical protein